MIVSGTLHFAEGYFFISSLRVFYGVGSRNARLTVIYPQILKTIHDLSIHASYIIWVSDYFHTKYDLLLFLFLLLEF